MPWWFRRSELRTGDAESAEGWAEVGNADQYTGLGRDACRSIGAMYSGVRIKNSNSADQPAFRAGLVRFTPLR